MKRLVKQALGTAVAIVIAGVLIAVFVWVVATTQGARWLLASVPPLIGIDFSAKKVEGRIIDHLLLSEVRVFLSHQKVEFDTLELRWKPLHLLAGTVDIQELTLKGARVQDDTPPSNKPPILSWPRMSESAYLFDGKIARLQVINLSFRRLQEQPVQLTRIAGSLTWKENLLSITDLKAASPIGQINGTFSAGFKQPSLTADLAITLEQPMAEMDQFSLQASRSDVSEPEQFFKIKITGTAGTRKLLDLSGDVGMAKHGFNLRRLHLNRPGQKGLLTADGSLTFNAHESFLSLQVKAAGFDLTPDLNVPTNLSGTLRFSGTLDSYRGDFTLANQEQGWEAASVSASYHGTRDGIKLAPLTGSVLDGSLAGKLDINWSDGFTMRGEIRGRNLNPARIDSNWKGVANFNASGKLTQSGKTPVSGSFSCAFLESRLHGQALTGDMLVEFAGKNISLARLSLNGKGFGLQASGDLNHRINLTAQINDLSRLVPGSSGTLQADGWIRRIDGHLSSAVSGTGSKIAYAGTRISAASLIARLDQGTGSPLHIDAFMRDVIFDHYILNAVTLTADGTLPRHTVNVKVRSADSEARLALSAVYNDGIWQGVISRLSGRDNSGPWNLAAPTAFVAGARKFILFPLVLNAGISERLEVAVDLVLNPLSGQIRAQWTGINLTRANPYLKDMQITGSSHGSIQLGFLSGRWFTMAGSAAGSGTFTARGHSITLQRSLVTFDGSEKGMRGEIELGTADGGRLKGTFSSPAPFSPVIPERGELTVELSGIDLALLKPWLPAETRLEGLISCRANGKMLPGQRFELNGNAQLSGGMVHRKMPDGELKLTFKSATASWSWQKETLDGALSIAMAEYGQARANFQLPVPARFPVAVNRKEALRASLVGQALEKGIITALFPGLVQESSGELDAELDISGTWEVPLIGGTLRLANAGAYLPTAGIHLKDVRLAARLEKNLIRIDSFRAISGPGYIEGTMLLTLSGWQVIEYKGTIRGENFQTVFFPELRILSTPDLSFEGTPHKLTLRGEMRLPELQVVGSHSRKVIAPSSDIIREGSVKPAMNSSPFVLDAQIRVLLGERVFVKVAGIDAQLGGAMDLSLSSLDKITSKGEIKVIKGRYRTYGVNLEIVRGRLFFAGGPIDLPSLDFLALRTIGNIRAGVTVAGTLQEPVIRLYSEPAMPDVDVLAYIVLGHPLRSSGAQASLVTQAAGALLTSGQAAILQDQIKNYLGLSTLEIQDGVGATSSTGYKPLQVTPAAGAMPVEQQAGISDTVLTVGKYLTPQLYISYGKSLFTGSNLFRLRYDIYKKWQIETQTGGGESGVDLYYKLEFN